MKWLENKLVLSLLSALLLSLSWVPNEMPFLAFFGIAPLLKINDLIPEAKRKGYIYFRYLFLAFFIWNVATTYWLSYADPVMNTSFYAFWATAIANACLMTLPFLFYRKTKRHYPNRWGRLSIIPLFLAFEYMHYNWELSWTWLNLGNVFATYPKWIQWYNYTGVLGGTLWIISVNYLIYNLISKQYKTVSAKLIQLTWIFCLPLIISFTQYYSFNDEDWNEVEACVVQPNYNSHTEKYRGNKKEQVKTMLNLSKQHCTDSTKLLFWPETALQRIHYDEINRNIFVRGIRQYLKTELPNTSLITGTSGFEIFDHKNSDYSTDIGKGKYKEEFNSAVLLELKDTTPIYHKSKLVPLVERIPYQGKLFFMKWFAMDLGEMMISLNIQEDREVFETKDSIRVVPAICFESVFGEFVTDFSSQNTDIISILTNDSWWYYPIEKEGLFTGSKLGYKQHFNYARLRAIENRKYVVRSANTGISGFINAQGEIINQTEYWKRTALTEKVKLNRELSFYAKNGDVIGRICLTISLILLLSRFVSRRTENFKYRG